MQSDALGPRGQALDATAAKRVGGFGAAGPEAERAEDLPATRALIRRAGADIIITYFAKEAAATIKPPHTTRGAAGPRPPGGVN